MRRKIERRLNQRCRFPPKSQKAISTANEEARCSVSSLQRYETVYSLFACTAFETIPYTPKDWFYRPGYHAHWIISTTLLATCKRIYLEAFTLPLRLNEHTFWDSPERGSPWRYSEVDHYKRTDLNAFFDCLTPQQRFDVQEVHLFAQPFWLEDLDLTSGRVAAKKIKLTLRHQDWYYCEIADPIGICPWLKGYVEEEVVERERDRVPSLPRDLDSLSRVGQTV
jgi:hypothetical protein